MFLNEFILRLTVVSVTNMINTSQQREINKAKSYEDIIVLRRRISDSVLVNAYKKTELLSWVDVRQGELWWETLPEPNIQTYVRTIYKK